MKKKQDSVNNTEMGRRGFLKRTVLASAAICIAVSYTHLTLPTT